MPCDEDPGLSGQLFDDAARIADCYCVGWDVFGYAVADGNRFSALVADYVFITD